MPQKAVKAKNTPEGKEFMDRVVHQSFITEGTMIAFPLCFPGASRPVTPDESLVSALAVDAKGIVYAGTGGRAAHLVVGMFHGLTGMVLDLGVVADADSCAAICLGEQSFLAFVNGPAGGKVVSRELQSLPFDLLQEWSSLKRTPFTDHGVPVAGERIVHAVAAPDRRLAVGQTERHVFTVTFDDPQFKIVAALAGRGRLFVDADGTIFGPSENGGLWSFDPRDRSFEPLAFALPASGSWRGKISATLNPADKKIYLADDNGAIFTFTQKDGVTGPYAKTTLPCVGTLAATFDGRVFGTCGAEVAHVFSYDPANGTLADLGVAGSVIHSRRYGHMFADAATGRDGEIIFGEYDNLGHLWLFFPRILPR